MTKHDLNFALAIAFAVVVIGLGAGFLVGTLTRPAEVAAERPSEQVTFTPDASRGAGGGSATGIPGYGDVYVNDYADLLDPAAETSIRDDLIVLYDQTGIEMTVLTIQSLATYGYTGSLESFATALFNDWGIGNASSNDGVLVLVSEGDRRMRIEIGAGYSVLWNDRMQRVIDEGFLPDFRNEDYQAGILTGVDETIFELTGNYPDEFSTNTLRRGFYRIWHWIEALGAFAWGLLAAPVGAIVFAVRRHLRNRPRACDRCGTVMLRAGEEADDEHLDGGQRLEEYLRSVDYDVWHCPSCAHMLITRHQAWFSGYSACPQCSYRTLSTTAEVLQAATKSSTGRKRLDYDCSNCGYHDSEIRTIPKVSSSSGSGSSRSSFGGGSSSGGGASGSW
ncbi:TPM domain-containing protein [Psychromarinibacter sp. S121]|uniref:TPM domain-containing protein n=1 Tax=Psychromarinibacter sp. S121 TaxID=3415127 RepID=UPI003C7BC7E4